MAITNNQAANRDNTTIINNNNNIISSPNRNASYTLADNNSNNNTSTSNNSVHINNDRVIALEKEVSLLKMKLEKSSEAYQQIVNQSKRDKELESQLKDANDKINSLKVEKHTLELSVKVNR